MATWSYQCLLFLVLVFSSHATALLSHSSLSSMHPSQSCPDHERLALLQFMHSFIIDCAISSSPSPYPKVKSWLADPNGDCCLWNGVKCDDEKGHVIGLDLSSSCLYGNFPSNSTLFSLVNLQELSLSHNNFNYSRIPSELGQLTNLRSLNASHSTFKGQIPTEISKLSMLSVLDLGDNHLILEDPSFEKLVQNLTRLKKLVLVEVDISSPIPNALANLTSLTHVSVGFCNLYGQFPANIFNLPQLETLYLSGNTYLSGFLPEFKHNSPLRVLQLPGTAFSGEVPPSIGRLAHLEELQLCTRYFSGKIPSSLGNLTKLIKLVLCSNDSSGDIPSSLTNLTQLDCLSLSNFNSRPKSLLSWIFKLKKLRILGLHRVSLAGGALYWLKNLTRLEMLSLSDNQLEGSMLFQGISQLPHLHTLVLSENQNLSANFVAFLNLQSLTYLELSGIKLSFLGETNSNKSSTKLKFLYLNSCNLTEFPQLLRDQDELQELALSNNKIRGLIPQWFVNVTKDSLQNLDLSYNFLTGFEQAVVTLPWRQLEHLYLQGNQLQGSLPIPPTSMVIYQISNNQLSGAIPHEICGALGMACLDVSNNKLSGRLPDCIIKLGDSLSVLNLQDNNFNGTIPQVHPEFCTLRMINLARNQLEGHMPRSFANCSMLEVLDISHNHVNDTFPSWLDALPRLRILILAHNNFHGRIDGPKSSVAFQSLRIIDLSHNFYTGDFPSSYLQNWGAMKISSEGQSVPFRIIFPRFVPLTGGVRVVEEEYNYSITITNKGNEMWYSKILTVFRVIDFSSNNFTGNIPDSIGELRGLQAINLSNNNLVGKIPSSLANIKDLESLDLSKNMLSGEIPPELTDLTFLEVFNVSYNHLTGRIPEGSQFNSFDNSSFDGNLGLCGSPMSKKCVNSNEPPQPPPVSSNDEEDDSNLIDWIIRILGYIGGFAISYAIGRHITDRNHEWFVERLRKLGWLRS